jgi:hypothetical protein
MNRSNGLYILIILSSITMMLTLEPSTMGMTALILAIVVSIIGMIRNKTRKCT